MATKLIVSLLISFLGEQSAWACASAASGYYDFIPRQRYTPHYRGAESLRYFIGRVVRASGFESGEGVAVVEILAKHDIDNMQNGEEVSFRVPRIGCVAIVGLDPETVGLFATYEKDGERYLAGFGGPSF